MKLAVYRMWLEWLGVFKLGIMVICLGGCVSPTPTWETWGKPGATPVEFHRDLTKAEKQFDVFRAFSLNEPLPDHARKAFAPGRPYADSLINPFTALLGPTLVGIHKPDYIADKLRQNGWRPRNVNSNTPTPRPVPPPVAGLPPQRKPNPPDLPAVPPAEPPPQLAVGLPALPDPEPKAKIIAPPDPNPRANVVPAPIPDPQVPIGEVTFVQPGAKTLMINAGRLKGVAPKQKLQVERDGKIIGQLEIGEAFRDIALCRILSSEIQIRAGDSVSPSHLKNTNPPDKP